MVQDVAERAERVRDLRAQVAGLDAGDQPEIIFQDLSPQRRRVTLYSLRTGEAVEFPAYMAPSILGLTLAGGGFAFTAHKDKAPEYKLGEVKCFLHPESAERPIIDELGMSGITCVASHLANQYSKRIHARRRHKQEWAAYTEYLSDKKAESQARQQQEQIDATLALARAATGQYEEPAAPMFPCDVCGRENKTEAGKQAHMRSHN